MVSLLEVVFAIVILKSTSVPRQLHMFALSSFMVVVSAPITTSPLSAELPPESPALKLTLLGSGYSSS
jgi:hypothetical protein